MVSECTADLISLERAPEFVAALIVAGLCVSRLLLALLARGLRGDEPGCLSKRSWAYNVSSLTPFVLYQALLLMWTYGYVCIETDRRDARGPSSTRDNASAARCRGTVAACMPRR